MQSFLDGRNMMRQDHKKVQADTATQAERKRYNLMLISYLFMQRRWEIHEQVLPTGVINGKNRVATDFWAALGFNDKVRHLVSYPILAMYEYVTQNIATLEGDNFKQLDMAEKFWIESLELLYQILNELGLIEKLGWKIIKMPVKKCRELIAFVQSEEIEPFLPKTKLEKNWKANGKIYFELSQRLQIENFAHIFTALSAFGYCETLGVTRIKMTAETTRQILTFCMQKFNKEAPITAHEVEIIYKKFKDDLLSDPVKAKTSITGLLRSFWYRTAINNGDFTSHIAATSSVVKERTTVSA